MSPRWHHRSILTLLPQTRKQLTTLHGCDTTERILEYRSEAETPWHQIHQDRASEVYKEWLYAEFLFPRASAVPCKEVSSELSIAPQGKRKHRGDIELPQHWRSLHESLPVSPMKLAEESLGLAHWESDCDGKVGRCLK